MIRNLNEKKSDFIYLILVSFPMENFRLVINEINK